MCERGAGRRTGYPSRPPWAMPAPVRRSSKVACVNKPLLLGRSLNAATDLFNRNPWTERRLELVPRNDAPFYAEDGLWTYHGHNFVEDPRFVAAYRRAVRATGADYCVRWRAHTILWAAQRAAGLDGAFVECGTGRGFMAVGDGRQYLSGERPPVLRRPPALLPLRHLPAHIPRRAGRAVTVWTRPSRSDAAGPPDPVARNFAEWPGVQLVVGKVPDTRCSIGRRVLHVDFNHPAAEGCSTLGPSRSCTSISTTPSGRPASAAEEQRPRVRHFWPRLTPGAPMIFDEIRRLRRPVRGPARGGGSAERGARVGQHPGAAHGAGPRRALTLGPPPWWPTRSTSSYPPTTTGS